MATTTLQQTPPRRREEEVECTICYDRATELFCQPMGTKPSRDSHEMCRACATTVSDCPFCRRWIAAIGEQKTNLDHPQTQKHLLQKFINDHTFAERALNEHPEDQRLANLYFAALHTSQGENREKISRLEGTHGPRKPEDLDQALTILAENSSLGTQSLLSQREFSTPSKEVALIAAARAGNEGTANVLLKSTQSSEARGNALLAATSPDMIQLLRTGDIEEEYRQKAKELALQRNDPEAVRALSTTSEIISETFFLPIDACAQAIVSLLKNLDF